MLKKIKKYLDDPKLDIQERSFVLLSVVGLAGILVAVINGLVLRQPVVATTMTAAGFVIFSLIVGCGLRFGRLRQAMVIIASLLVFGFLPAVFFTSGGIDGGAPVWFAFATLYIVMILEGKRRAFFLINEAIVTGLCWHVGYRRPEWVTLFESPRGAYLDSITALFIVGGVMLILVSFQTRLYRRESERAEEKAKEVEELNRAQNRFFSSMSHEIRTPINTILGLNELILRQEDASDEIVRDAGNIQGAGKMLLALINDILDFSKIEAGSMDIVPVEYRVGDMLSEIVNMIWLRANDKGLKFNVDVDPQVPAVLYGDEVRIKQILINLLNNAVKYTPSGSVGLHIESEDAGKDRVLLKISVSDTGMGIKQEAIPYLFDAFRRVDQEKNRRIEGTGLGLSIVKQLVELMGGTVSVNSVYTQGSTFTVELEQSVVSAQTVGDISITNTGGAGRKRHEHRFSAPEARILIVDDNEMNLEVERKLLGGTEITVDTASGGAETLKKTLTTKYDAILMDHLMPEMDGVECLEKIRSQTGGLNTGIPVVVLTANAGSEDRELYDAAGFDGYLVKPVSGRQLEDMLLKLLPAEKVIRTSSESMTGEEMNTARGYTRKQSVVVTTGSMSDLPDAVIKQLGLNVIPWTVHTKDGTFRDGVELGADEMIRYINAGNTEAYSAAADAAEYVAFFGSVLKRAHHVIHIALTTSMSSEYAVACEAAKSFENVTVVNSECLSSATGILVLVAYKLAQQNRSVEEIVEELEAVKKRIHCSFIIKNSDYMARRGFISKRVHRVAKSLEMRPCLRLKNDRSGIGGIWLGDIRRCYDRYISKALKASADPDTDLLFVTYVDVPEEDLNWIEGRIWGRVAFDHVVFQQASAAISSNCGPGTFGLLYMDKGKNYNLGSLLPAKRDTAENTDEAEETDAEAGEAAPPAPDMTARAEKAPALAPEGEDAWLADVPGIDYGEAVKSCGGAESFRKALELFYRSIEAKAAEIEGYWRDGDLKNYTIKVHALKSSARLIGARELSEQARAMEAAGNAGDTAAIDENTPALLARFRGYTGALAHLSGGGEDAREAIDAAALAEAYASLVECAGMMDYDMAEMVLDSLGEYRLPPEDESRVEQLRAALIELDWERVAALGKG